MERSAFEAMSIDEMEQRIGEREEKLKKICRDASSLVHTLGKVLRHEIRDAHTCFKGELKDFKGVSILLEEGLSMFGGARLQVRFQGELVLHLEGESLRNFRVEKFIEHDWVEKLHALAMRKEELLTQRTADVQQHDAEQNKRHALVQKAEQLGFFQ